MSKPFENHSGGPEQRLAAIERKRRIHEQVYLVATVPDAAQYEGLGMVYVQDGAAGNPVMAFSDGSDWRRCDTLAVISET